MEDEDKKIRKLEEHKQTKLLVKDIADLIGVTVQSTENDDSNGDFVYEKKDAVTLIKGLDKYLGKYKV